MMSINLSDFDFELPKELIAQQPARPRNHSRLLIYDRATGNISDDFFYNLDMYLPEDTTLVLNDSKVEKSRLRIGSIEIFVLDTLNPTTTAVDSDGIRTLSLNIPINDKFLDEYRLTPLPPYIKQDESLSGDYQTVFARPLGSKAAPTAGLHFTKKQLADIEKTHPVVKLTLHVGIGTFAPVKEEDISKHHMHAEQYFISQPAADELNKSKHITAVGTTSLRCLESAGPKFSESNGWTDIFITPGYKFHTIDSLVTNFHLPNSTLLMLVAAMTGVEELQRIYKHAVDNGYRFYSFGDAMLVI
jgi:S-adenosylmethionine:tRNA ribosyltransferase-isomerase